MNKHMIMAMIMPIAIRLYLKKFSTSLKTESHHCNLLIPRSSALFKCSSSGVILYYRHTFFGGDPHHSKNSAGARVLFLLYSDTEYSTRNTKNKTINMTTAIPNITNMYTNISKKPFITIHGSYSLLILYYATGYIFRVLIHRW